MRRSKITGLSRLSIPATALVLFAAVPAVADVPAVAAARTVADVPVTLRGSSAAMQRQHAVALDLGYAFVRTPGEMTRLEGDGELVRMEGNENYGFRQGVTSLVARPEMRTFIERLSSEYHAACDEKLIVTSLTRPTTRQPRNAHRLSVHPAGIAVDLRVSGRAECRRWLEDELLAMEEDGLLDATRERSPPHYHIALFPDAYMARVQPEIDAERALALAAARAAAKRVLAPVAQEAAESGGRKDARGMLLALLVPVGLGVVVTYRRRSAASGEPE